MKKKDIDFGLKDIKIENYKLKKSKFSTYFTLVFFFIILVYIFFNVEFKKDDLLSDTPSKELNLEDNFLERNINLEDDQNIQETDSIIIKEVYSEPIITEINYLSGKYYIIAGSFSNYNLSLNKANEIKNFGFNCFIISPINQNKMYRVAVDNFDNVEKAKEMLTFYKEKINNELWILKH